MAGGLVFFSPAHRPSDEEARQAVVDGFRWAEAADDPRLAAILERAAEIFGAPSAAISIIDGDRQEWVVRRGLEATGTARALSFCGHVVANPADMLVVPDALEDKRFAGNPLVDGTMASVRFYAGASLMQGASPIGALCVIDGTPGAIDDAQRAELGRLAGEVMKILAGYR